MVASAQGPCGATLGALWPGRAVEEDPRGTVCLTSHSQHFQKAGWAGELGTESHLQGRARGWTCLVGQAQPGHHTPVTGRGELAAVSSPCPQAPGCRSQETTRRGQVRQRGEQPPSGAGQCPLPTCSQSLLHPTRALGPRVGDPDRYLERTRGPRAAVGRDGAVLLPRQAHLQGKASPALPWAPQAPGENNGPQREGDERQETVGGHRAPSRPTPLLWACTVFCPVQSHHRAFSR